MKGNVSSSFFHLLVLTFILISHSITVFAQSDQCKKDIPYIICNGEADCARIEAKIKKEEDDCRAKRNRPKPLTPEEIEAQRQYEERADAERRRLEEQKRLNDGINAEMNRMEREANAAELNKAIDAEMQKKGDGKIVVGSAEMATQQGIPYETDIRGVNDGWDAERRNLFDQRLRYPNPDFLNGPAPQSGDIAEGCRWETLTGKVFAYGVEGELLDFSNPLKGFIANVKGQPYRLGSYMVIKNLSSRPAFFGIGSQGGTVNNSIPPKSSRKIYIPRYTTKKVPEIWDELTVRYCVPVKN